MTEKLQYKIISAAYGDANLINKIYVKYLSLFNDEVKNAYLEYKNTAHKVNSIKLYDCPEELLNFEQNPESNKTSIFAKAYYSLSLKPAISFATILLAVITILFWELNFQKNNGYTNSEIQYAEKQVQESLVLISGVFNKTKSKVKNDILNNRVKEPILRGFDEINYLFK